MCICLVHFSRHPHRTGAAHSELLEYIDCRACPRPALFNLKIAPSLTGILTPTHPSQRPGRHLDWLSRFCTACGTVPIFYSGLPFFPVKIAPSHGVSGPYMVPGPCESTAQIASQSVQLFLHGSLLWHTDQLTDHATPSVTVLCICVVLQYGLIITITHFFPAVRS